MSLWRKRKKILPDKSEDSLIKTLKICQTYQYHIKQVVCMEFFPPSILASASWDRTLKIVDISSTKKAVIMKSFDISNTNNRGIRKYDQNKFLAITSRTEVTSFCVDPIMRVRDFNIEEILGETGTVSVVNFMVVSKELFLLVYSQQDKNVRNYGFCTVSIPDGKVFNLHSAKDLNFSSIGGCCLSINYKNCFYVMQGGEYRADLINYKEKKLKQSYKGYSFWANEPCVYLDSINDNREILFIGGGVGQSMLFFDTISGGIIKKISINNQVRSAVVLHNQYLLVGENNTGRFKLIDLLDDFKIICSKVIVQSGIRDIKVTKCKKKGGKMNLKFLASSNRSKVVVCKVLGLRNVIRKLDIEMEDEKERIEYVLNEDYCSTMKDKFVFDVILKNTSFFSIKKIFF